MNGGIGEWVSVPVYINTDNIISIKKGAVGLWVTTETGFTVHLNDGGKREQLLLVDGDGLKKMS